MPASRVRAWFEPDVRYTSTDLQIYPRLVERAWCAKQLATYRWLAIDVSRRQAAPREPAHAHPQPPSQDHETSRLGL